MRAHPAGPRHGDVLTPHALPYRPQGGDRDLDASIWPITASRTPSGEIEIGGCRVSDLVAEFGSPLFVIDERDFRSRAAAFKAAYDVPEMPADVYYAAKAFLATTIARWVDQEGLGIDVSTGGEMLVALQAGVDPQRILFHGNNKSVSEIDRAVSVGIGRIVVDSLTEIDRVSVAAVAHGRDVDVLVRVTVGVEAHTHEYIATAHEDQKFGLSLAGGAANTAIERVLAAPGLRLKGLHSHIGSQIFDAAGFEVAAARVVGLAAHIRSEHQIVVDELNLGGGMGIAYVPNDDPLDVKDMATSIRDIVRDACSRVDLPIPRLAFEPGRAIVGPSGITVYEVGTVKDVALGHDQERQYVSVDGGMSDNIRTALYDADYTVVPATRASSAESVISRVVGKHCESGDIVVRDAWLPADLHPGDLLAVAATGAYCRSMASQYNYLPRPGVVAVQNGNASVVLRRESDDDLIRLDPGAQRSSEQIWMAAANEGGAR
ncbi:MAG: diaminopimelate decarboxylase [Candidatus Nanopelagicales bacterium]